MCNVQKAGRLTIFLKMILKGIWYMKLQHSLYMFKLSPIKFLGKLELEQIRDQAGLCWFKMELINI